MSDQQSTTQKPALETSKTLVTELASSGDVLGQDDSQPVERPPGGPQLKGDEKPPPEQI